MDARYDEATKQFVGPLDSTDSLEAYILLGRIAEAVKGTKKVRVHYIDRQLNDHRTFDGVARHVVAALHDGFARLPWTPNDRLRITTGFEWFLPLRDILDLEII